MKRTILVWISILIFTVSKAQEFPSELWHQGFLVLVNEDTLTGKLKYNFDQELLQIDTDDKIYTFSGNKVFYFQIFDQTVDRYRQFYTLPYALVNKYQAPVFFEVLVEGKLTLLCRETIAVKIEQDNNPYPYASRMTYSKEVLSYNYYFLDVKGKITEYSTKKKDLLQVLSKRADKVDEYMRVNHLKADRHTDIMRILSFYNGII